MRGGILGLAALLAWAIAGAAQAADRVALVIGNATYANAAPLSNPGNDADDVGSALERLGFETTVLRDLDGDGMRAAIRAFAREATDARIATIYYAGHGVEVDGRNYLLPVDADLDDDRMVAFETVPLTLLSDAAGGATELALTIVDACRDNPFRAQMTRSGGTRSVGRGLARVDPRGLNSLVAFAAAEGAVALDGDGRNSPFASALVETLNGPPLEVRRLLGEVRDRVLQQTAHRQKPHVYGSIGGAEVFLHDRAGAAAAADEGLGADADDGAAGSSEPEDDRVGGEGGQRVEGVEGVEGAEGGGATSWRRAYFREPRLGGRLVDNCLHWGRDCGAPAAMHFCRRQGYDAAERFSIVKRRASRSDPALVIGDDKLCSSAGCGVLVDVVCTEAEHVYETPRLNGAQVDNCLTWAKDCGRPAADAFCRSQGHALSLGYEVAKGVASLTDPALVQGDGLFCDTASCGVLRNVACHTPDAHFEEPRVEGKLVDWCLNWARNCGRPAADLFCKRQGFAYSIGWRKEVGKASRADPTLVLADGRTCRARACGALVDVSCMRRP